MSRWMAVIVVAGMFVVGGLCSTVWLDRFPERMPTHWGIDGQPDAWAPRDQPFVPFLLFPTISMAVLALGMILPWLSPARYKVDPFRPIYDYVFFLVSLLFAWMYGVFLLSAVRGGILHAGWLTGGVFLFFALIGNVLGKVRANFWMGVRTPWTLASEIVWERTHRFAAWLFVAVGLIGFVASIAGLHPIACFVFLMVGALTPVLYSLVIYKRLEKAGTL